MFSFLSPGGSSVPQSCGPSCEVPELQKVVGVARLIAREPQGEVSCHWVLYMAELARACPWELPTAALAMLYCIQCPLKSISPKQGDWEVSGMGWGLHLRRLPDVHFPLTSSSSDLPFGCAMAGPLLTAFVYFSSDNNLWQLGGPRWPLLEQFQ